MGTQVNPKGKNIVILDVAQRSDIGSDRSVSFDLSVASAHEIQEIFSKVVSGAFANSDTAGSKIFEFSTTSPILSTCPLFRKFLKSISLDILSEALWLSSPSSDFTRHAVLSLLLNSSTVENEQGNATTAFSSDEASELLFDIFERLISLGKPKSLVLDQCVAIAASLGIKRQHLG